MTKRLRVLNAVILLCLATVSQVIWKRAHDANIARNMLRAPFEKTEFSLPKPPLGFSPLKSASYLGVAEGNLFSPDRNSTIRLEEPPVNVLPAPPLPLLSGVVFMDGLPATILLSGRSGIEKHAYHQGETVGNWQIDSFDRQQIVLEWQGNRVTKPLADLMDRSTTKAPIIPAFKHRNDPSLPQSTASLPPTQPVAKQLNDPGRSQQ